MKLNKIISIMIFSIIIMSILCAIIPNKVNAETAVRYFGILEKRDDEEFGYAISDPNYGGAKLWRIVEYTGTGDTATLKANGAEDVYCLKEGQGFLNTQAKTEYNLSYNMKTEKEAIAAKSEILRALVEDGTIDTGTVDGEGQPITVSKYNTILALGDLLYLFSESAEARTAYLQAAGIEEDTYWAEMIKDGEIEAIQQATLWYFTQYGDTTKDYDKTDDTHWLNYTLDGNSYESLANYNLANREGQQRQEQAELLYKYLIDKAIENAAKYEDGTNTGKPAQINTTTLNYTEEGTTYKVGPINISETGSTTPYTIGLTVKTNGTATTDYTMENEDGETITVSDLKDLAQNGEDFYIIVEKSGVTSISVYPTISYTDTTLTLWTSETGANTEQPLMIPEKTEKNDGIELVVTPNEAPFDLALRKYITKVNGVALNSANTRVPNIDETTIATEKTATYKHRKDPVVIKTNDVITYELTIYNEGQKDGRATKIVDQLPTGLEFVKVVSGNFDADTDNYSSTGENKLTLNRKASNEDNLGKYTEGNLQSETIEIECKVTAQPSKTDNKILTNVAWIAEEIDAEAGITITNQTGADRDSEPSTVPQVNKDNMSDYTGNNNKNDLSDSGYYYKGQQDDDDFEKLMMLPETFDLKLIKNITEVNSQNVPERLLSIDVSNLNKVVDGNVVTTADYEMNETPVAVKKGDIVTYRLRVYNEGTIDGYASKISEDIPEGLEFIWSEKEGEELDADTTLTEEKKEAIKFNQQYLWGDFEYDDNNEKIIKVSTDYLSKEKEAVEGKNCITAFGSNDGNKTAQDLDYREVYIKMLVVSDDTTGTSIRNEAAITADTDKDGNEVDDRDSDPDDWREHPNHEDDEDHDYIVLRTFDLALRKFIIAVNNDENIDENNYLKGEDGSYKRAPKVDTTKLNTLDENGKMITTAIYNHTKEPIIVKKNDYIIYMLRVYNEGDIDGYAGEIKDHLPPHLEYVEDEFNSKHGWEIGEDGRTVTTTYLADKKIDKAVKNQNGYTLSYVEVPIMCKVKDTAVSNENITNIADITLYLDDNKKETNDRDSEKDNVVLPEDKNLPSYKDDEKGDYIPGQEDDDDFEKVIVKEFDLALRKWVTQAIVTDSTGTTVTNTGHQPYDDPEQVVKVELHRKKISAVTVKFRYSIRVINEGDLEGYAKEVTDYIPQGLKFVAEDNPGWTDEGNNVISTRLLENTLLKPGEYADVEVILTWINDANNMGVKTNIAEISEDYNEYDVPDRDSTPDNKKPGEDDIDDAPVMLTVATGRAKTYFTLGTIVLITLAGGVILIKKYVL
ncbi:MAG: Cys-Gln thioester bond-forming surface protein [Clostridia bacterium]|nr:Cys-Gln thioester bond-forming surface protein [Clostridia bacterium]